MLQDKKRYMIDQFDQIILEKSSVIQQWLGMLCITSEKNIGTIILGFIVIDLSSLIYDLKKENLLNDSMMSV